MSSTTPTTAPPTTVSVIEPNTTDKFFIDSTGNVHRNADYKSQLRPLDIVRWVLLGLLIAIPVFYFAIGYTHARYRLKNGKEPLGYHAWLVRRRKEKQVVQLMYPFPHTNPDHLHNPWAVNVPRPYPSGQQVPYMRPDGAVSNVEPNPVNRQPAPPSNYVQAEPAERTV